MGNIKIIFIVTTIIIMIVTIKSFYVTSKQQKSGTVIILNGPSASGKSSIQKEFQYIMMPQLWIKLGIDILFDKPMPDVTSDNESFLENENPISWFSVSKDTDDKPIVKAFFGEQGDQVAYGMNSAIAAYAQNGCNIIVDYIAYKKEWIDDLQSKLKDINTYWVKVSIPLETLEQREATRATSPQGHARSHYHTVYWDLTYDVEVNSEKDSALHIAQQIKDFITKKS